MLSYVHQYYYSPRYLMMFKMTNCEDLKEMAEEQFSPTPVIHLDTQTAETTRRWTVNDVNVVRPDQEYGTLVVHQTNVRRLNHAVETLTLKSLN